VTSRSHAVPILQLFAITLMLIPSDTVIRAIGASGYPASLVAMFAFFAFIVATIFGQHNPLRHHHPVRSVLCLLWLSEMASYVLMSRGDLSVAQSAAADRMVMQLMGITGVAIVAAESLNSMDDVRRVMRALVWGGAACGVTAALQFFLRLDVVPYLRELPGFSLNFDNPAIFNRDDLNRVAGTAIHPIELGVVSAMLLPLAIHLAYFDTERSARRRWAPVILIGLAIPASISRSAILTIAVAFIVFIVAMPARRRLAALAGVPIALGAVFMSAHGLIGTFTSFFEAGTADQSIATRVSDYPMVERLVHQAPWFGHGPGTYQPDNMIDVLDNQYLKSAIEFGLFGVVALLLYVLVPTIAALIARRHTPDPELRLLCAALAGSTLASGLASATFDSWSFPMFASVQALIIGLIGAAWRLAAASEASVVGQIPHGTHAYAVNPTLRPAGV
jgi:hypothetical protein